MHITDKQKNSFKICRSFLVAHRACIHSFADTALEMRPVEKQVYKAFREWMGLWTAALLNTEAILHWPLVSEETLVLLQRSFHFRMFPKTMLVCIIVIMFDVSAVVLSLTSARLYVTLRFPNQQGLRFFPGLHKFSNYCYSFPPF